MLSLVLIAGGCGGGALIEGPSLPLGEVVSIDAPLGLPPVPLPADNRPTPQAIALGERLFHEKLLSSDRTLSCASCHRPEAWYVDGSAVSTGVSGRTGRRNAPSVINAAYQSLQFWDGRATSLEEQAAGPIANSLEMNLPHRVCVERLEGDADYRQAFSQVFGADGRGGAVTMTRVVKAIASYERTLLSGNSAFDRYHYGHDQSAMSKSAVRGLAIFTDEKRGNCVACHTIGEQYALFTDGLFHNLGAGMDENGELRDAGRFEQTGKEADRGSFRTPTLRNVARTAPYMHDGSLRTLREVIDFYVGGGNSNPQLDSRIRPLELSARDRDDLLAFLEALNGEPIHRR